MITKSFGYSDPFTRKPASIDTDLWREYKKHNFSIFPSTDQNKKSHKDSDKGSDKERNKESDKGPKGPDPDSNIGNLEPIKLIRSFWANWMKRWPK